MAGFTETQIMELTAVVNNWNARSGIAGLSHNNGNNGSRKLDTELIVYCNYIDYIIRFRRVVMRIFDMIILGYIFKVTTASLVKAANIKLLYIPAAFASLWLAQYSLLSKPYKLVTRC